MLRKISLFASGSVVGAVIDYGTTLTLTHWARLDPAVALGLSMIVSASVVFVFHNRITFHHSKADALGQGGDDHYSTKSVLRRYVMFMGWSGLVFALRAFLMKMLLFATLPLPVALILAIGLVAIVNYTMSSLVIFKKKLS